MGEKNRNGIPTLKKDDLSVAVRFVFKQATNLSLYSEETKKKHNKREDERQERKGR
jgi:hypothetical protein